MKVGASRRLCCPILCLQIPKVVKIKFKKAYSKMVKRCSAAKCYNSQMTHNKIAYFGYPKNETIAREWAKLAGRQDLVDKKLSNLTKYFICSQHFTDDAFVNPEVEDKSFLRLNKIPEFPNPSIFEDNLLQNVETVKHNTDKFVNYSKTSPGEPCKKNIVKVKVVADRTVGSAKKDQNYIEVIEQDMGVEAYEEYIEEQTGEAQAEPEETASMDDYCRLCVTCPAELVPIFNGQGKLYKYTQCVSLMPRGMIDVEDGMPQYACRECIAKLQSCANIIEDFVNNQSLFVSQ